MDTAKQVWSELWLTIKKPLLYIGIACIIFIALIPPATYIYFARDITSKETIMNRSDNGLILLDRNNKPFFTFYQPKRITFVSLKDIPIHMQEAVIVSEDKEFYDHPGFSLRGIARALYRDITHQELKEGGSTITQQLVKNALLHSQKNFLRKYQELVLAYEIERRYSKNDILEMYLNSVYFGEGAFGVGNAAQTYFGKEAKELTLAEASLLASLLPAPSALSPVSNDPTPARVRQQLLLTQMVEKKEITQAQATNALNTKFTFNPEKEDLNTLAPHFALMVKDELIEKYGEEYVIRSGFRVKTTLDATWQEYAERIVKQQVANLKNNEVTNGAVVVIDPKTGEIRVLVGSHDWFDEKNGKINMVVSPRQPGSSFKPIIYAHALERRIITSATILDDSPKTFEGGYKPLNYDKKFRGKVTVRRALANSLNIPAVEVMEEVGVANGLDYAKRLGITTLKDPSQYGLSLVLGAAEVKLLELTDVYAAFANNGVRATPFSILEIKDKNNKVVLTNQPSVDNVISSEIAFIISSILSDNKARSEVFGGALTIARQAAVKTGTTEEYRDALTMGYTPNLAIGVWVGNNDNTPMDNIAGSLGAAPIWRSLMNRFLQDLPYETFKQPRSVIKKSICPFGKPTNEKEASESAYEEFFMIDTQPVDPCDIPPTPRSSSTPGSTDTPTPGPTNTPAPQATNTPVPTNTPAPTPTASVGVTVSVSTPTPTP